MYTVSALDLCKTKAVLSESHQSGSERSSVPRTARDRARAEITVEILEAARRRLAADGAPALSLRAVARDLGMTSSAVYRYVASRDDLLTWLIVDAYNSLGVAAQLREAAVGRDDLIGRFFAVCDAVRAWALANPHEYALIYGSPVPGYVAPADTIAPASRVAMLLVQIIVDATVGGRVGARVIEDRIPPPVGLALAPIRELIPVEVPDVLIQLALMTWTALYGMVSFELFGQLQNVVEQDSSGRDVFFAECARRWAALVGLS